MRLAIPNPADALVRLLASPLPYAARPLPLRDRRPDPGLFGPESVTWRVMREPLLMLGAGRALLMQAANPLVAQGAIDFSTYRSDPYGRLERTVEWVTIVCFGTTDEARRATDAVLAVHRRVQGTLPEDAATPAHASGAGFRASDLALLRWVHASFVDTMLRTHTALVGELRPGERDAFVREWHAVARLMGLRERAPWRTEAALHRYIDREIAAGRALPGAGSRAVAETVLHPPARRLVRPGMEALAFIACGLLPAPIRRGYGITWTPLHAAAHRALCTASRASAPVMARRFRVSPVYDRAVARVRRGGGARAA